MYLSSLALAKGVEVGDIGVCIQEGIEKVVYV
jgi:hypothetical protein